MKKFFTTMVLSAACGVASASLPYTDMNFRPNPINKPVAVVTSSKPFLDCIQLVEDQSGVRINVDRKSIAKAGISVRRKVAITRINCPAIEMVCLLVDEIDPNGKLAVFYEKDGSLTIGADE